MLSVDAREEAFHPASSMGRICRGLLGALWARDAIGAKSLFRPEIGGTGIRQPEAGTKLRLLCSAPASENGECSAKAPSRPSEMLDG